MSELEVLPLFRREALDARRNSWLGSISIAQPLQSWLLTGLAVLIGLTIAVFLITGSYARRTRVVGHLVPVEGLIALGAPATAYVTRVPVVEGKKVAAGQVLVVLRSTRSTLHSDDSAAAVAATVDTRRRSLEESLTTNERQYRTQQLGLQSQLADARQEHERLLSEIALRQRQLHLLQETTVRWQSLYEQKFVSQLQWQQHQSDLLSLQAEHESLRRQAAAARRLMAQLRQSLSELPERAAVSRSGLQRELAGVERDSIELLSNHEHVVRAPRGGVVSALMIKPGQSALAGQFLVSLLPGDGHLEAELLAPSRAIGFVERGDRVRLRYQAYPFQKFGLQPGRVSSVGRSALGTEELKGFAQRLVQSEPLYRIAVQLERQSLWVNGRQEPLRPGMLLDADIIGERRRLYEWLFEPLYAIRANSLGQSASRSR